MLLRKQLPAFATQTAGATNLCQLTEGYQYSKIVLELGDDNGTILESGNLAGDIVLKMNDREQWRVSAQELQAEWAKRGPKFTIQTSGVAGTSTYRTYIPLWFDQPWVDPKSAGRAFALNAVAGSRPQILVDLEAGLVNPVISGHFEYLPLSANASIGLITKFQRQVLAVSGTSNEFTTFASISKQGDLIQGITIHPNATTYVNKVKFTRNGVPILDDITYLQNQVALMGRGWSPDTTATPRFEILFDHEDAQDPGLITAGANELTLKAYYAAANNGTMNAIVELLGNPA